VNHPTPLELHDHAYGFRVSAHVAGCARCQGSVEEIARERAALRDALSERSVSPPAGLLRAARPVRRSRMSFAGLAAAAVLLGALAWLLFRAPRAGTPDVPADSSRSQAQAQGFDLDRLIAELKSPSPLRREIAVLAIRAFGSPPAETLEKAQIDPSVQDQCLGITPAMREVHRKLDSLKIDLQFENAKSQDILSFMRDVSGLNIIVNAVSARWLPETSSLTVKGQSLRTALQRFCDSHGLKFQVTQELVVWVDDRHAKEPEVRVPIRVRAGSQNAAKEIGGLESEKPEVRDRATAALRRMGFGAEQELWGALEGGSPERRARAGDLLRSLYSQNRTVALGPTEKKTREIRCTIDMQNARLTDLVYYLSEISGMTLLIDPSGIPDPENEMISFKVQDIVLDGALRLLLQPRQKAYVVVDDLIVLSKAHSILKAPQPPFLATPEEAKQMEQLLEDLGSVDPARQRRAEEELVGIGEPALGPVAQAERNLEGAAAGRARSVRLKIAQDLEAWYADEPSGADLQGLTPAQKAVLEKPFSQRLEGKPLKEVLDGLGLTTRFKAGESLKPRGCCQKARIDAFLRATLRPAGLDFYLDGETIVVDTAANVRSALKK
jgi:hypothetical protein